MDDTRQWRLSGDERDSIIGVLMERFSWPGERATREVDDVSAQVPHLYRQSRGHVPVDDIWAHLREFLVGGRSLGRYTPERGLAPYVTRSARREMASLIGGGPSIPRTRDKRRDAATLRARAAAPLTLDTAMPDHAPGLPGWEPGVEDRLLERQRRDEQQVMTRQRINEWFHCLPIFACRWQGLGPADYITFREQARQQNNPLRCFVARDAARQQRTATLYANRGRAGRDRRARAAAAGMVLWTRRNGTPVCRARRRVMTRLAVSWVTAREPVNDKTMRSAARELGQPCYCPVCRAHHN